MLSGQITNISNCFMPRYFSNIVHLTLPKQFLNVQTQQQQQAALSQQLRAPAQQREPTPTHEQHVTLSQHLQAVQTQQLAHVQQLQYGMDSQGMSFQQAVPVVTPPATAKSTSPSIELETGSDDSEEGEEGPPAILNLTDGNLHNLLSWPADPEAGPNAQETAYIWLYILQQFFTEEKGYTHTINPSAQDDNVYILEFWANFGYFMPTGIFIRTAQKPAFIMSCLARSEWANEFVGRRYTRLVTEDGALLGKKHLDIPIKTDAAKHLKEQFAGLLAAYGVKVVNGGIACGEMAQFFKYRGDVKDKGGKPILKGWHNGFFDLLNGVPSLSMRSVETVLRNIVDPPR